MTFNHIYVLAVEKLGNFPDEDGNVIDIDAVALMKFDQILNVDWSFIFLGKVPKGSFIVSNSDEFLYFIDSAFGCALVQTNTTDGAIGWAKQSFLGDGA